MIKSIECYVPSDIEIYLAINEPHIDYHSRRHSLHLQKNLADNFGDAYNAVMKSAFENHEVILVCNDDIVFTPDTFAILQAEYTRLTSDFENKKFIDLGQDARLGWLGARTDFAVGWQNIRASKSRNLAAIKYPDECEVELTDFIAPICAVVSRDCFIPYEPLNYFSDDLNCKQMELQGSYHFISTAYVHHVGSQTIGRDVHSLHKEAVEYFEQHPDMFKILKKKLPIDTEYDNGND